MTETTIIGFCLKCRKKSVMNESTNIRNVVLPITGALGYKSLCSRCGTIIFKIK